MSSNLNQIKQRFGIIGKSAPLDRAINTAVRVATTDLTVMIQGESGVGKEIFSRIIHDLSKRKHNPFIAINCGAIPPGTINSELFGHEKGSFTGATGERKGYFETVSGGTIFLDEIGEMPLDTQAYLLRILETGEFLRVGASKVLTTDVRVVAATNITLEEQIKKGKFREDLFYRLNTVPIRVPALHERPEDIFMLFRKFASDYAEKYRTEGIELEDKARQLLELYRWPGNVRELKNVVEQLSVLSNSKMITDQELYEIVPQVISRNLPATQEMKVDKEGNIEREILYKFLAEMKEDLNALKNLVYNLIKNNDLSVPESANNMINMMPDRMSNRDTYYDKRQEANTFDEDHFDKPIIIRDGAKDNFHNSIEIDEPKSFEDMEKELIKKALKKYSGRRKDTAEELGISERTLYRKIKQYDIPD
jgi:transcriptional regulator with PAS, ATPase and Fis domain